jgi:hypothetical protein
VIEVVLELTMAKPDVTPAGTPAAVMLTEVESPAGLEAVILIGLFQPRPRVRLLSEGVSVNPALETVSTTVVVLLTDPEVPVTTTG